MNFRFSSLTNNVLSEHDTEIKETDTLTIKFPISFVGSDMIAWLGDYRRHK